MHTCPECGQACYCHGDIDDCEVETEEYAAAHCTHYLTADCIGEMDDDEGQDFSGIGDDL
jgi:hypothetical protein